MIRRRSFLKACVGSAVAAVLPARPGRCQDLATGERGVTVADVAAGEDIFTYVRRQTGDFEATLYKQILGAANEFKEGDQIVGIAAANDSSRQNARVLLANTKIADIDSHPLLEDRQHAFLRQSLDAGAASQTAALTLGQLKQFLLEQDEPEIKQIMPGLSSDVIGCVVKLLSSDELIAVGAKVFNPLPGSNIGARGYLGARIQPNSPTDNVEDIRWQVFDGFAYAVGDVVLGTNPVSSDPVAVAAVERTLQDVLVTFGIDDAQPHCVLAHVDVQAEVERTNPGSTALWFQSIAGSDTANGTFDITLDKMLNYARQRSGRYGLYFETGQGADFTNGHSHGFDMVLHESRKYGFARALTREVAAAQLAAGREAAPWVHVNDVAGFIGPEVFRTREQLVRCCLEDIVMGKLHGLPIGLDVCATLHMDTSLADLDWCLDEIMPANPAYLMALPTKIDPMLGYLTTGFQDHVRLRERFGFRVNDRMWRFFQELSVIDAEGRPTEHFGDPIWVYLHYCRCKGDTRSDTVIREEGRTQLAAVRSHGVFIAEGHAAQPWDLEPQLAQDIGRIYSDAKQSIWTELNPAFMNTIPAAERLATRSHDRSDYILHPQSGERLSESSVRLLRELRQEHDGQFNVQVVVSDGLNALAIMDDGHLTPFLAQLHVGLRDAGYRVATEHLVVTSGRVRAGYRIGETLFGGLRGRRVMLHVIGERPGTGHHTFSVYITAAQGSTWGVADQVDHNITKVVSGIAVTALPPRRGAEETVRILQTLG